jgi:hypothetical protein
MSEESMYVWPENNSAFHIPAQAIALHSIFEKVGTTSRFLVDIGANNGYASSNTRIFLNKGWRGLMFDSDCRGNSEVIEARITPDNIETTLSDYGCPTHIDLLSIDIDGQDYYVWQAIQKIKPRVVCIEYNAHFTHDERVVMARDDTHEWDGSFSYGASLKALVELAGVKGYDLVGEVDNLDVIFARKGLCKPMDPRSISLPYHPLFGPYRSSGPLSNHSIVQTRAMIDLDADKPWGAIGHAINGGIPTESRGQHGMDGQIPFRRLNVRNMFA